MDYTSEEKQIAQAIVGNPDYCNLIAKVFLDTEDKLTLDFATGKNDEELGQIVRAQLLAEAKVKIRWNKLKQLGQESGKSPRVVPR